MSIEKRFDVGFMARLTSEEKQIQQNYRPVIGVHKWFARRPGSLFRGLLVSEFGEGPLAVDYYQTHDFSDVTVLDPFMGGGTTLFEANRLGCNTVGLDINPMAYWVVRQELSKVDRVAFREQAEAVLADVERELEGLYQTRCVECDQEARVKYFLWVKTQECGGCGGPVDLFPGYLVASNARHTHFVLHCPGCRELVQVRELPKTGPVECPGCAENFDWRSGNASRNKYQCAACGHEGSYPAELREKGAPRHRLFGIEYACETCRPGHKGRWFKTATEDDLARFAEAEKTLRGRELLCPDDEIPDGDETRRLHRWGYKRYREMFNARQLLGLGLLVARIRKVEGDEERHALATVFSDFLRYQNMLCRYDTYALKCQDIFSVHGFPVGLIQCENNVTGIPRIGSGGFRHFVEKYDRAKAYCEAPFETVRSGGRKRLIPSPGERIEAKLVRSQGKVAGGRRTLIRAGSVEGLRLKPESIDGVFTDPPYYDNVQYAELMDFCYSWLRLFLAGEVREFTNGSTRSMKELTGNKSLGRDVEHFTEGLASVFSKAAGALKPGAPFVFTYHHNDVDAYVPVAVAILDAGLRCEAVIPAPAEMTASLHINGTRSSVVDSVFVCRRWMNGRKKKPSISRARLRNMLIEDRRGLLSGGVKATKGDLYCLALGHLTLAAVMSLREDWNPRENAETRMARAREKLLALVERCAFEDTVDESLAEQLEERKLAAEATQTRLFDELVNGGDRKDLSAGR